MDPRVLRFLQSGRTGDWREEEGRQRGSPESQTGDNVPFLSLNAILQLKGKEENRVENEKRKDICVQGRGTGEQTLEGYKHLRRRERADVLIHSDKFKQWQE